MGGPCRLRPVAGKLGKAAPACTDNFQVRPFQFDAQEWESVEQCYQAQKFICPTVRLQLQQMKKHGGENDSSYGMRVWRAGQINRACRPDWDAVKVEIMRRVNLAKYLQHPDLRADLLATEDVVIAGAPSTSWTSASGEYVGWNLWNGLIQMRIREELRPPSERNSKRNSLLDGLKQRFDDFLEQEGGVCQELPLPEEGIDKRCERMIGSVQQQQQRSQEHDEDDHMMLYDKPQESKEQALECEAHALHALEALVMKSEQQRRSWESDHAEIARVFKSRNQSSTCDTRTPTMSTCDSTL